MALSRRRGPGIFGMGAQTMNLNLLFRFFQRKNSDLLITKILRKLFFKKFCNYWYVTNKKRNELDYFYWGRQGGFKNAIGTFNQPDDYWLERFGRYSEILNSLIVAKSESHGSHLNVVEIGCGLGQWVKRLRLFNPIISYSGIDINTHSIKQAQKYFEKYNNVKFKCGNIRDIEFLNTDLLIACQILFFLDVTAIRLLLSKIPTGAHIVLCEPVNPKLSYPRQSRGFISVSPSKGQKHEAPEGADSHT